MQSEKADKGLGFDFDSFVVFDEAFRTIWDPDAEKAIVSEILEPSPLTGGFEEGRTSSSSKQSHNERFGSSHESNPLSNNPSSNPSNASTDIQPFKMMRMDPSTLPGGDVSTELAIAHHFHESVLQHQRQELRKNIVRQYFKYVNFNDMSSLTRLMHKHFHENVVYAYPGIREPIKNKAEYLLLLAFLVNTYPDGIWQVTEVNMDGPDKVICKFYFKGTTVYSFPLDTVFKQLKAQAKQEVYMKKDDIGLASVSLLQDTTMTMHASVIERFKNQDASSAPLQLITEEDSWLHRVTSSLAGVERQVLREGAFAYRRQVNFYFDGDDKVVKVVGHNFTI